MDVSLLQRNLVREHAAMFRERLDILKSHIFVG
jgi:hypothetical protein